MTLGAVLTDHDYAEPVYSAALTLARRVPTFVYEFADEDAPFFTEGPEPTFLLARTTAPNCRTCSRSTTPRRSRRPSGGSPTTWSAPGASSPGRVEPPGLDCALTPLRASVRRWQRVGHDRFRGSPLVRLLAVVPPLTAARERARRVGRRHDGSARSPAWILQEGEHGGDPAMHRLPTNSRLLTLRDARIHSVFGNYGNACVDGVVVAYLTDGQLPANDLECVGSGSS
ncbi:alpha/beta hydrolase [Micromonospora sp. M12]